MRTSASPSLSPSASLHQRNTKVNIKVWVLYKTNPNWSPCLTDISIAAGVKISNQVRLFSQSFKINMRLQRSFVSLLKCHGVFFLNIHLFPWRTICIIKINTLLKAYISFSTDLIHRKWLVTWRSGKKNLRCLFVMSCCRDCATSCQSWV